MSLAQSSLRGSLVVAIHLKQPGDRTKSTALVHYRPRTLIQKLIDSMQRCRVAFVELPSSTLETVSLHKNVNRISPSEVVYIEGP